MYKYQGQVLRCEQQGTSLMFYLSNFNNGSNLQLSVQQFSSETVALIGANCDENSWQVITANKIKKGDSFSFDVAVPFTENHGNPLVAQAPLNVSDMFWSWQLGHKFLRFDAQSSFSFHLGSTGCKSPSKLRPAKEECQHPNRYNFTVKNYQPSKPVIFDLDKLFAGVDVTESCMSSQSNENCQRIFSNLREPLFYQ